jgi:hypothetical protein
MTQSITHLPIHSFNTTQIYIQTHTHTHTRSYVESLALEANDMLQEAGYLTISELCNAFDLPFDFLLEVRACE